MNPMNSFVKIPVLTAGIFTILISSSFAGESLGTRLFEEGRYPSARTELLREKTQNPDSAELQVLFYICELELGRSDSARKGLEILLARSEEPSEPAALAAYHLGCLDWDQGHVTNAAVRLIQSLQATHNPELFHQSAATLDALKWAHPKAVRPFLSSSLQATLDASRPQWTPEIRRLAKRDEHEQKPGLLSLPGRWIVAVYRTQISCAIGQRCSLYPSCSEYFLQASKERGLLGIPMLADRLVREPGVVSAGEHPVIQNKTLRFADPIHDHIGEK